MADEATPIMTRRPKTLLKIERRAWLRFPSEQDIVCYQVARRPEGEPEVAWLGNVRDVSPVGIGLNVSRWFEPGAELIVELPVKAKGAVHLPVWVVHATPDRKGRWIIGCEFIHAVSQEKLQNLFGVDLFQPVTRNFPDPVRPASPDG